MCPIRNGLKKGDDLSSLLFNFDLQYAIRKVKANHMLLKFKGTHQFIIYVDSVNLGVKGYTRHASILEVDVEKGESMFLFHEHNT